MQREALEIAGIRVQVLVSSHETGGRYSICRIETDGPGSVPVLTHSYEDVCFFVEAGEFHFDVAGSSAIALQGSLVFIPHGTAYRLRTGLREACRLLLLAHPGGVDLLFHDVFAAHGKSLQPILEKHGITLLCDVYSSRRDLTDESHR